MKPTNRAEDIAIKTLLLTDLVDSTLIFDQLGDQRASEVSLHHERMARDLLIRFGGLEIDKTDGFLMVFDRPLDAVCYALSYHSELEGLTEDLGVRLRARAGLHLGEVILRQNRPEDVARGAKPLEVEGHAKPTAARVMSLAGGGQTLITRGVFDLARRAVVGDSKLRKELEWECHGAYMFKGIEEPLEIFEVGLEVNLPFVAPGDSGKARRVSLGSDTVEKTPEEIGRYRIISQIGQGGQSRTYRAYDPAIDRDVLIKRMISENLSASTRDSFRKRFVFEAKAAGQLTHSNIGCIYDVGTAKGEPYIAMEFIEGDSLDKIIRDQKALPPEQVISVFEQLCDGLQHAHDKGIVHRDIKPANVMIDRTGKIKIVDFGIARLSTSNLTQTGTFLGTPYYMSPEQIRGLVVDRRSDLFSCGVMLYQLLTGVVPFSGETPTTVIFKIVNDDYPPARECMPDLPPGFDDVLSRALAKDPEDRYQSCDEFVSDLLQLRPSSDPYALEEQATGLTGTQLLTASSEGDERSRTGADDGDGDSSLPLAGLRKYGLWSAGLVVLLLVAAVAFWPDAEESTEQLQSDVAEVMIDPVAVEPPEPPPPAEPTEEVKPVETAASRARAAFERGETAFQAENYTAAVRHLETAKRLTPRDPAILSLLGQAYSREDRTDEAIQDLARATELDSEQPEYVVLLALELAKAERFEEARLQSERAIELGGTEYYPLERLETLHSEFVARRDLAELIPLSAEVEHDHFVGGCKGVLTMDDVHLSYESSENSEHSFVAEIRVIQSIEKKGLDLTFRFGDKNYRFKLDSPDSVLEIYQLVQQINPATE